MLATEVREFFKLEVRVLTESVILENVDVKFNSIILQNEEDDVVEISNRRCIPVLDRTTDGFRCTILILNEGEKLEERIDYLIDEDYEIKHLDLTIKKKNNGKEFAYTVNHTIGEQLTKEVEVEISDEVRSVLEFLSISVGRKNCMNKIFEIVNKDADLTQKINTIASIEVD